MIMTEWKTYRLKDVTSILGDGLHGTPVYDENGDVFFINGNNLENGHINIKSNTKRVSTEEAAKYRKPLNDRTILVSINGTIGNVGKYNNENCILGKSACYFNVAEDFDYDFIYYVIANDIFKNTISRLATGTTIKNVSLETMRNYTFCAPDITTQRRISKILGAIDDKIENNRRINTNLELLAQALYKQWFVDFDFPNEDGKPYKSSGGKMIDSELGPIPDGWRVGLIKDIVNFQSGFPFKSELFSEQGTYRLITIKGVQDGYLDVNGAVYIKNIPDRMPPYCLLTEGDIIMSLTGNVGRCCIVDGENLLLNQRVVKLQPTFINSNMFIYTMFRRESFKEKLITLAKGTAQANLSPIETANMRTITPSASCLVRFNKLGQSIFKQLLKNIKENNRLAALRDTLLPKLMNGEIKIDE